MITDEQMITVGILQCPGIGRVTFEELSTFLECNEISIVDFWDLPEKEIKGLDFLAMRGKAFIEHRKTFKLEKLRKELDQKSISIVTKRDQNYPSLLKETPDAPAVLYVLGYLRPSFKLPIAIVGTRKISSYGWMATTLITKELVKAGCEIISGFMYGVDAVAHQTALNNGGYTIGVLGYGFDYCFPENHRKMRKQLLESGGALISEYLPFVTAVPGRFPARNRIVAGMCKGIVVTEAATDSGSKITASRAADYGRDIFAVPGSITSEYSEGTKELLNDGAKLVANAQDILEVYLPTRIDSSGKINITVILNQAENEIELKIIKMLLHQALTSEEILEELKVSAHEIVIGLSVLEMRGVILNDRGKYSIVF